jgi:hypothetical protein
VTRQRAPGDIFAAVSVGYAAFRPRYPRQLFEFIASVTSRHGRAWECGAGSGQATVNLAEWFDEVVATDVSAEQIARAPRHQNDKVRWVVASAESTPLRSRSVDLIAVAQALHWFDFDRFYAEVRRVAATGATIEAWTYAAGRMEGDIGVALKRFTFETLAPYWPPQRRHVDEEYRTIPFPFERITPPALQLEERWPLGQLVGFMRTWSAVARYTQTHSDDPVYAVERELASLWGDVESRRRIVWPMVLVAGRVTNT